MPRPSINLELYKAEIISLFQDSDSASIAHTLQNKYNLQVREHTIRSHLKKWKIHKRNCTTGSDTILHTWIKILFFENGLEEKELLCALQNEGFEITARNLQDL